MEYPPVSVVMPVRNEERHLAEAVRHVLGQDYPGEFELVLAVGPSADRTEQIARDLAAAQPRLTVVPNPTGQIPAALNAAVRVARHAVIARMDGHALMPSGYLATAVGGADRDRRGRRGRGDGRRGRHHLPAGRGLGHDLQGRGGLGRVPHRRRRGPGGQRLPRRLPPAAIEQAGGWDEGMLRAEDWDLNYRIRAGGGRIWFTPDLRVTYRPRASVRTLGRAVLPLRPLAPGDRSRASGDGQLPLPGPAGRGGPGHGRAPGRRGRPGRPRGGRPASRAVAHRRPGHPRRIPGRRHRGRGRAGPRPPGQGAGSGSRSSSPSCTWPGAPASSPARAGCTASPTRVSGNRTRPQKARPRPGQNEPWTSTCRPCSPPTAMTATSCTAGT